jgi:hypothetical protein
MAAEAIASAANASASVSQFARPSLAARVRKEARAGIIVVGISVISICSAWSYRIRAAVERRFLAPGVADLQVDFPGRSATLTSSSACKGRHGGPEP